MSREQIEKRERAKQLLSLRQQDYQKTLDLQSPHALRLLEDLAKFCRASRSTFDPDPRVHAVLEGRREVWLRIEKHLGLNPEQLLKIYYGGLE